MGSLQTIGMAKRYRDTADTAWTFCPCCEKPGTCHTTKMGSPTLVLITHFAAEIMLIAFLNQACERTSSEFECHLIADVAECIWWIYALSLHINPLNTELNPICHLLELLEAHHILHVSRIRVNGGTNTMYFWDDNTLSSGHQSAEDCYSHMYDTWMFTCYNMSRLPPAGLQWLTYVGLCFHIVWCNAKCVCDREILETYLNSASKNTSETVILPHGTKSLLTNVIIKFSRQLIGGPGCSIAVIFNWDVLSLSFF